jgi:predicted nucleic acid-binding protein
VSLKVFIDTNIFLDSYLERDKGVAKGVFDFLETSDTEIYLNDISIINIAYIVRKKFSKNEIQEKINLIINQYHIVPATKQIISDANNSAFKDFEDGVQYFCAKEIDADLIITNNKKDFTSSEIEVLTAVEFSLLYIDS